MGVDGGGWWQTRWFIAVAMLAACIPLVWPPIAPLTDLPGHIGRYRVMLDGGAGPLAQWYDFHWRPVGNLGVDLLVTALAPVLGLEPAVKLIVMAIPALTVGGILALSRAAHGRVSPYAIVALPLAYNQTFQLGFVNYTLAMALMLHAVAGWLRAPDTRWRGPVFFAVALAIWFCHLFGWAILCLAVFAIELAKRRDPVSAAWACRPLAAPVPLMILPWLTGGDGGAGITGGYSFAGKLLAIVTALRDHWAIADVAALAVIVAVIIAGLARGVIDRRIGAAAIAVLAALVILPGWVMGSAYADTRVAPCLLIFTLVALAPTDARQARTIASIGLALCVVRLATTTASFAMLATQQQRAFAAIDRLPVGARVLYLVRPGCDRLWAVTRADHWGGFATARRRAFANDQFRDNAAAPLQVHYAAASPFDRDPSQFLPCDDGAGLTRRLATFPRAAFDHLWLVGQPRTPPERLPGMTRLWSADGDAIYAISPHRGGGTLVGRPSAPVRTGDAGG